VKVIAGIAPNGEFYSSFDLIEFERRVATAPGVYSSTFYRYCNASQNLTYAGAAAFDMPTVAAVFTSRSFSRAAIVQTNAISGATTLELDDEDDFFKNIAIAYDLLDWRLRLWTAGVAIGGTAISWISHKLSGRVEDVESDLEGTDVCRIDVSIDARGRVSLGPREKYGPNCRFRFKNARCGYVGVETECNRTWTRCGELLNQARFGGWRKIPAMDDLLPVWGATQKTVGARSFKTSDY
jgi:hypothetical protein